MPESLSSIRATLDAHDQGHLLAFLDELTGPGAERLLTQIAGIDFGELAHLMARAGDREVAPVRSGELEPAPFYPRPTDDARGWSDEDRHYRSVGEEVIRAGRVAAFAVAGGQATRLGWSGPKGTFPATAVSGRPLLGIFAEQVLANQDRYRVTIPFYIMTSPLNDEATRAFFHDNNYFGLNRRNILMIPQRLLPSIDAETSKILLADKGTVAMHPDGHGGAVNALAASGALDDMAARGIDHISYFQVDNPLVNVIDPLFVGLHTAAPDSSSQMSSKVVPKTDPDERVGVLCRRGGRTVIIEYSDLPPELAAERDETGTLRFDAGSIAVHLISVSFLKKLAGGEGPFTLPVNRARKAVPHVDTRTGRRVVPQTPNAIKLEWFIFDALPLADAALVYQTSRLEEFAPIKNASGADSPATSHQLQSDRNGRWLETHGVAIPRDHEGHVAAKIEISPLTALSCDDLAGVQLPAAIEAGEEVVL